MIEMGYADLWLIIGPAVCVSMPTIIEKEELISVVEEVLCTFCSYHEWWVLRNTICSFILT